MTEKYKNGVGEGHSRSEKWQERTNHLDTCVRSELRSEGSSLGQFWSGLVGELANRQPLFSLVYC